MATTRTAAAARRNGRAQHPGVVHVVADAAQHAKHPAAAAGAALGGLALGAVVGARLHVHHRRPRLLGLPLPHGNEVRTGTRQLVRAGRRLYALESDVRALREQADETRRQSPIEVLLSGLTNRRLPRRT
jgi:hypothetical protein